MQPVHKRVYFKCILFTSMNFCYFGIAQKKIKILEQYTIIKIQEITDYLGYHCS